MILPKLLLANEHFICTCRWHYVLDLDRLNFNVRPGISQFIPEDINQIQISINSMVVNMNQVLTDFKHLHFFWIHHESNLEPCAISNPIVSFNVMHCIFEVLSLFGIIVTLGFFDDFPRSASTEKRAVSSPTIFKPDLCGSLMIIRHHRILNISKKEDTA